VIFMRGVVAIGLVRLELCELTGFAIIAPRRDPRGRPKARLRGEKSLAFDAAMISGGIGGCKRICGTKPQGMSGAATDCSVA
jgi:hypothetical protein